MQPDVVVITDMFPPEAGNRSRRMAERIKYLTRQGLNVHVVCPDRGIKAMQATQPEFPEHVTIHRISPLFRSILPSMRYAEYRGWLPRLFRPLLGFIRWVLPCYFHLRKIKGKKVILYTMNNPVLPHVVGLAAHKRFAAWIAELRDPIRDYVYSHRAGFDLLDRLLENSVMRRANRVCLPKGLQVTIEEIHSRYPQYKDKIHDLGYVGVDVTEYLSQHRPSKLVNDGDLFKGIFAGHFYTSPQHLLDALDEGNRRGLNIHVDFFANQSGAHTFKGGSAFRGLIPYPELIKEYQSKDFSVIFDLVSEGKGSIPFKIFELIALRKPIFMIGCEDSYTARIVSKHKLGVTVSNAVEDILDGLWDFRRFVAEGCFNYAYFDQVREEISSSHSEVRFYQHVREMLNERH